MSAGRCGDRCEAVEAQKRVFRGNWEGPLPADHFAGNGPPTRLELWWSLYIITVFSNTGALQRYL